MVARLSLKTVTRDSCMMLVGTLLGFVLAQTLVISSMSNGAGLCNSNEVAHIAKRASSQTIYKNGDRNKG